jgi:mono/diheme cytochrome c family protein
VLLWYDRINKEIQMMPTSKTLAAMGFVGLIVLATNAMAQTPSPAVAQGEGLFKGRCAGCHETGAGGAPAKDVLAAKTPDDIFHVLKDGPMMAMASGLTDDEMKSIAAYLTAGAAPAAAAPGPTAAASPATASRGAAVFKDRCKDCHDPAAGDAPEKATLAMFAPDFIFGQLKNGKMMPMAAGLSDDDMHAVAAYLTAK